MILTKWDKYCTVIISKSFLFYCMKKLLLLLVLSFTCVLAVPKAFASTGMAAPYHLDEIKLTIQQMDAPLAVAPAYKSYPSIKYFLPSSGISWTIALKEKSGSELSKNRIWPNSEIIQLRKSALGYDVLSKVNAQGFAYSYRLPGEYACIAPLYLHVSDSYGADVYLDLNNANLCTNVNASSVILENVALQNLAPTNNASYPLQVNSSVELAKVREHFSLVKSANNPKVYLVSKQFGVKHHVMNMDALRTWWDAFDQKIDIVSDSQLAKFEDGPEVAFRPGTLVKSINSPKVYMSTSGVGLLHVNDEAEARKFAGNNWNQNIYTISQNSIDNAAKPSYIQFVPDAINIYDTFPYTGTASSGIQLEYQYIQAN